MVEKPLITEVIDSAGGLSGAPADDMKVVCALEAKANDIVGGDPTLRHPKHFQSIQIDDVTTFVKNVKEK